MNYRRLPRTELDVSPICLGTMTFGTPVDQAAAVKIVHHALDSGINFIDTADIYEGYARYMGSPGGRAEEFLGEALKGRRDQAVVATKVGNPVGPEAGDTGLSRAHITRQIEASLERLRTDYVDLYLLHRPDPATPLEESIRAVADLISQGKVRHWGFSNFDAAEIREMIRICDSNSYPRPVVSQPPYSWLQRDVEREHLPACREFDIAITPYQPLQGGLLTGKYKRGRPVPEDSRAAESTWLNNPDDALLAKLEKFQSEAHEAGLEAAHYALRWLLDQEGIYSVVVGVKTVRQLENLTAGLDSGHGPNKP